MITIIQNVYNIYIMCVSALFVIHLIDVNFVNPGPVEQCCFILPVLMFAVKPQY